MKTETLATKQKKKTKGWRIRVLIMGDMEGENGVERQCSCRIASATFKLVYTWILDNGCSLKGCHDLRTRTQMRKEFEIRNSNPSNKMFPQAVSRVVSCAGGGTAGHVV